MRYAESAASRMLHWLTSPAAARLIGEPLYWLRYRRSKGKHAILFQIKRIVVVRLDQIGDLVMTTPFLRELRRNLPEAWITLVVKPANFNLVELCPYVNQVLTYDWETKRRPKRLRRHGRALALAWKHFLPRPFDLAIVPRYDTDLYNAAFVAYFSGAPWRVGFSESVTEHKRQRNFGFEGLFTDTLDEIAVRHEVEHNLEVIRFLGGTVEEDKLELWLSREDDEFAQQALRSYGVRSGDLLVAFGPGAGKPRCIWPLANFVELGAWLKSNHDARVLVLGGGGEEPLGLEIHRQLGDKAINTVGRTTLRQAAALLKHCNLYVGNDSGLKHIAAAVGLPVIEINPHSLECPPLDSGSPVRFGPWRAPHRLLQPEKPHDPCSGRCAAAQAHCIVDVSVRQVQDAVAAHLSRHRAREAPQRVSDGAA